MTIPAGGDLELYLSCRRALSPGDWNDFYHIFFGLDVLWLWEDAVLECTTSWTTDADIVWHWSLGSMSS